MANIGWKDQYVDVEGVGATGSITCRMRLGDFKVVMKLRDPLNGHCSREVMCIFRNCASVEDPEVRNKMHTVISAIQLEAHNLIVEDNHRSERRIHHLETGEYTDLMFVNGVPRVLLRHLRVKTRPYQSSR
jgi:hypothetical protein